MTKHATDWETVYRLIEHSAGHPLLIEGERSAGKTYAAENHDIDPACVESTSLADDYPGLMLTGFALAGTFVPGPAWRAFARSHSGPSRWVINEVEKAGLDAASTLLGLTHQSAQIVDPHGNVIRPDWSNLQIIMTCNSAALMSEPLRDRATHIRVDRPPLAAWGEEETLAARLGALYIDKGRCITPRQWRDYRHWATILGDVAAATLQWGPVEGPRTVETLAIGGVD